jgi:hypothetical protein
MSVSDLVGLTMTRVTVHTPIRFGGQRFLGDNEVRFESSDGRVFRLYHSQDCCENVDVEDICGDIEDLVGAPILMAEESTSEDSDGCESKTWTFYKFATMKGYVTIRWLGESNGYYSESVELEMVA